MRTPGKVAVNCRRLGRGQYACTATSPLSVDCAGRGKRGARLCSPLYKHALRACKACASPLERATRGVARRNAREGQRRLATTCSPDSVLHSASAGYQAFNPGLGTLCGPLPLVCGTSTVVGCGEEFVPELQKNKLFSDREKGRNFIPAAKNKLFTIYNCKSNVS